MKKIHFKDLDISYLNSLKTFNKIQKIIEDAIRQKYSIDRIDVNGNYSPKNTRLTTSIEQARNRRNSIRCKIGKVRTNK